jgi:hypothetical protein
LPEKATYTAILSNDQKSGKQTPISSATPISYTQDKSYKYHPPVLKLTKKLKQKEDIEEIKELLWKPLNNPNFLKGANFARPFFSKNNIT